MGVCGGVCARVCSLGRVRLFVTSWAVVHQAPLSVGSSRQEDCSGHTPGDLPHPGIEPTSLVAPALTGGFFGHCTTWEAQDMCILPQLTKNKEEQQHGFWSEAALLPRGKLLSFCICFQTCKMRGETGPTSWEGIPQGFNAQTALAAVPAF